jgi:hypothetical protein
MAVQGTARRGRTLRARRLLLELLENRSVLAGDMLAPLADLAPPLAPVYVQPATEPVDLGMRLSQGGQIVLGPGVYTIAQSQLLTTDLDLRGAGPNKTIIRLVNDLGDDALLNVVGNAEQTLNLKIADVTFDANRRQACGVAIVGDVVATLSRVEFRQFSGMALDIRSLTSVVATDCHFNQCGDAAAKRPAVRVADMVSSPQAANIIFLACQFEPNNYVGLLLDRGATGVHVIASKFHGWLPAPGRFDHVVLIGASGNDIIGTNFANGGNASIRLIDSDNNHIAFNQIAKSATYALVLANGSTGNLIEGNAFSAGLDTINGDGEVRADATSQQNVLTHNLTAVGDRAGQINNQTTATPVADDSAVEALYPTPVPASDQAPSGDAIDITDALKTLVNQGGTLDLPAGVFLVRGSLGTLLPTSGLTLRGAGMGKTILRVVESDGSPLLRIQGTPQALSRWFDFRDLTIDGGNFNMDAIALQEATLGAFQRVEFRNFLGSAIQGRQFWDTLFLQCQFNQCGDVAEREAAIDLAPTDPSVTYTNSNNIYLISCAFHNNRFSSVLLDTKTTKVRLINDTFSRDTVDNDYRPVLGQGTYSNTILGCTLEGAAAGGAELRNAVGNVIAGGSLPAELFDKATQNRLFVSSNPRTPPPTPNDHAGQPPPSDSPAASDPPAVPADPPPTTTPNLPPPTPSPGPTQIFERQLARGRDDQTETSTPPPQTNVSLTSGDRRITLARFWDATAGAELVAIDADPTVSLLSTQRTVVRTRSLEAQDLAILSLTSTATPTFRRWR